MTIQYNDTFKFNHVIADDGMVITDFIEGLPYKEYESFKEGYFPEYMDLSHYYEITEEEDAEYIALQHLEKIAEENKEDKNIKDAKTL
jgi:hypothetical protein